MAAPELREKLHSLGVDPGGMAPDKLGASIKADIEKYGRIVKAAGIKAE